MVQTECVTFRWGRGKRGWCRTETGEHSNVSEQKKVPERRSVAEDKAKLNVTSFYSSVFSPLSLVRDRALSRKVFSYLGLCLFLTAQHPCWHNLLEAENWFPSIPGQLSVRVWVPHPQEPPTVYLPQCTILSVPYKYCHCLCGHVMKNVGSFFLTRVKWFLSHLCMEDDFWI